MPSLIIPASKSNWLAYTSEVLRSGGLVAFPTDTVYGLAASAFLPVGIQRLYLAKGRSETKAIPVLLGDLEQLHRVTLALPEGVLRLVSRFWPGPLTIVVPRHPDLPAELSTTPTIGVRMPDHPTALEILRAAGPLATTSANRSGEAETRTAAEVMHALGEEIELIVDGGTTPGGVPSTVVDCTGEHPKVLRSGPIREEEIVKIWGR